jgi:hypothetical protein
MQVATLPPITSFDDLHLVPPPLLPGDAHLALLYLDGVQQRLVQLLDTQVEYLTTLAACQQLIDALAGSDKLHDPAAVAAVEQPVIAATPTVQINAPVPVAIAQALAFLQPGLAGDRTLKLRDLVARGEGSILLQPQPFPHYVLFGVTMGAFLLAEQALVPASGLPPAVQTWLLLGNGLRDMLADRCDWLELQAYDLNAYVARVPLATAVTVPVPVDGTVDVTWTPVFPAAILVGQVSGRTTWPTGTFLNIDVQVNGLYRITVAVLQDGMIPRLRDYYYVRGPGSLPPALPALPLSGGGVPQLELALLYQNARDAASDFVVGVSVQPLLAGDQWTLWPYLPMAYPQLLSSRDLSVPPTACLHERGDQLTLWRVSDTLLPVPPVPIPGLPVPVVTAYAYEWRAGAVPLVGELDPALEVSATLAAVRTAREPYYFVDDEVIQAGISSGTLPGPVTELDPFLDDPLDILLGHGMPGQWGAIRCMATEDNSLYALLPNYGPEPDVQLFRWSGVGPWTREALVRVGGRWRIPAYVGTERLILFQFRGDGYGHRFKGDTMTMFDLSGTFVPFGPYPAYPIVCGGTYTAPAAQYLKYRMPIYAVSGVAADFMGAGYLTGITIGGSAPSEHQLVAGMVPQLKVTTPHGVFRFTLNSDLTEANPGHNLLLGQSRTDVANRLAGFNLTLVTPTMDYDPCALVPNLPKRQYDVIIEKLDGTGTPELFRIEEQFIFDLSQLNVATATPPPPPLHTVYSYPVYPWPHLAIIQPS